MILRSYLIALSVLSALGANASPCSSASKAGVTCEVSIANLKPTQFAVGQREVDSRADKFSGMSAKKLAKYIQKNPALLVIGPAGALYVIDHSHLALALRKAGVTDMEGTVKDNLSTLNDHDFWAQMQKNGWVYLYDEQGRGPLTVNQLPATLAQMKDDPYRGLAWAVRKDDGYQKSDALYADFLWANFFRTRVKVGTTDADFDAAVKAAEALAHTPAAKDLPGWAAN